MRFANVLRPQGFAKFDGNYNESYIATRSHYLLDAPKRMSPKRDK